MQERFLGRIEPDMDVCDVNGDKIGTVARVYRYEMATVGTGETAGATTPPPGDEIVEVKSGFLGLGSHYYIPLSAIGDCTQGCLFVTKSKDEFDTLGWHEKPAHFDELH